MKPCLQLRYSLCRVPLIVSRLVSVIVVSYSLTVIYREISTAVFGHDTARRDRRRDGEPAVYDLYSTHNRCSVVLDLIDTSRR